MVWRTLLPDSNNCLIIVVLALVIGRRFDMGEREIGEERVRCVRMGLLCYVYCIEGVRLIEG